MIKWRYSGVYRLKLEAAKLLLNMLTLPFIVPNFKQIHFFVIHFEESSIFEEPIYYSHRLIDNSHC